jgi:hypothetical protein
MRQIPLYEIPVASTSFYTEAFYYNNCILFDYEDTNGQPIRTGIHFNMPAAFRERCERCAKMWHLAAYDKLVEIEDSTWAAEIYDDITTHYKRCWKTNHYMIYLDGICFEVIADSWELLPEMQGAWSDVFPDYSKVILNEDKK